MFWEKAKFILFIYFNFIFIVNIVTDVPIPHSPPSPTFT